MECRFHHVALKVKDFDTTVKFYKEVLGVKERLAWEHNGYPAAMLQMTDGGIIEVFGGRPDGAEANPYFAHFAIAVPDVSATYKKALECGAKPDIEPTKTAIDGKLDIEIAFVYAPGGEYIEFFKEL